ncbi:NLGN [Mytilus coruscus]|uniref:NLGN n=1 Tax=Mytilus coruscus TaxID=42192 RepID=A0A6J8DDE6_MYTCO|nr:NLGN [Mytilus coruscus]
MEFILKLYPFRLLRIVLLLQSYGVWNYRIEPRVYYTRYGSCIGMIRPFKDKTLHPVEVLSGFQYASMKGNKMRFIPPASSMEKWLLNRIFSDRSYRGICPQSFNTVRQLNLDSSKQYVNRLRRLEPHGLYQNEDCLVLNLYIPVTGKVHSKLTYYLFKQTRSIIENLLILI